MRCTNCGSDHAIQNAIEVDVAPNGAPTVLRCKLCGSTERRAHVDVDHDHDMIPSEPITVEEARAKTALLQQSLTELIN
ncbi:MAG: hypothetical protein WA741_09435 [Candidatus Sulfotelmatobacter sp.]